MYHNDPNKIELHDDVLGMEKSHLEVKDGSPVKLHAVFILRPDRQYNADPNASVLLHSTNGVNHRLTPLNSPDPALEPYAQRTPAQAVQTGQNAAVVYGDGNAYVTAEDSMISSDMTSDAAQGAADSRHYQPDLSYYAADFNDNETDATRAMRRQQELVDASTAKKRRDGSGPGNANSLRQHEADAEEEKQSKADKKTEGKQSKADKEADTEDKQSKADKKAEDRQAKADKKADKDDQTNDEQSGDNVDYGDTVKFDRVDDKKAY